MNDVHFDFTLSSHTTPPGSFPSFVQVIVILLFMVQALNLIQLDFLVALATGVIAYLPHLLTALVIVAMGLWVRKPCSEHACHDLARSELSHSCFHFKVCDYRSVCIHGAWSNHGGAAWIVNWRHTAPGAPALSSPYRSTNICQIKILFSIKGHKIHLYLKK
ncbi:mechanosensitive ion channel family protein [Bacillus sp. V3-13]|uniref:mechanosensitive ion channel family protein n=1 Tax=Bacillus sp. V3-13 TaxID=2053728 RepID=UPI001156E42F|nr:hypothetical protein [Bacillus sp. V3-13]